MTYLWAYTGLSWVVMGVLTFYVVRYAVKANELVELLKGINANQQRIIDVLVNDRQPSARQPENELPPS